MDPRLRGDDIHGYASFTGTPHSRVRLTDGYVSFTGTSHSRVRLIHGYVSFTGTSHSRVRLTHGYVSFTGTSHSRMHHFSLSTRPLTNHLCIRITTSTGGNIARIAVAITRFHSVAASPPVIIRLIPMTVVYMLSCVVTSSGQRY